MKRSCIYCCATEKMRRIKGCQIKKIKHKDVSTAVPQEKWIKYKMAAENKKNIAWRGCALKNIKNKNGCLKSNLWHQEVFYLSRNYGMKNCAARKDIKYKGDCSKNEFMAWRDVASITLLQEEHNKYKNGC